MRIPASVYRFQLTKSFGFKEASACLDYLKKLGISGLYCSPYLQTRPGSVHGYDITIPDQINSDLGTEKDFEAFCSAVNKRGLFHLFDLVANHMAASVHNPWWNDVLTYGPESKYSHFFDIDWDPPRNDLKGKLLLPLLLTPYQQALENKEISLVVQGKHHLIKVNKALLPISPESALKVHHISLDELLQMQHYRLSYWQEAIQNINYRRFFDVNDLAALRIENEDVFEAFHAYFFKLFNEGKIHGVRIDHPDGFYEPAIYFKRLQAKQPLYVVVEKILQGNETLPENWNVSGTVGYEYLRALNGLFIKQDNHVAFLKIYQEFIGTKEDPEKLLASAKKQFALLYLKSEITTLSMRLSKHLELPEEDLEVAIVELLAYLPIYRTYLTTEDDHFAPRDRTYMDLAFKRARHSLPPPKKEIMDLLQGLFFQGKKTFIRDFILRFQQISPSIMAKGLEDTLLYHYNYFISLNEVGSNPTSFGIDSTYFHQQNQERLEKWPHSMITTSTHDTKRGEDVRFRLNVLSEMPEEWGKLVRQWSEINRVHKVAEFPDPNLEYFIYQTLLGVHPPRKLTDKERWALEKRLVKYLHKAMREAKMHTNWINPNASYENASIHFLKTLLNPAASPAFWDTFLPFLQKIAPCGRLNSLSALTLKLGSPGVFDLYQGMELFDDSLVDPDNRRPVDFDYRMQLLNEIDTTPVPLEDERYKLYLLRQGLTLRQKHPELFLEGAYIPIETSDEGIVAFLRKHNEKAALFIGSRFHLQTSQNEIDIHLPEKIEGLKTEGLKPISIVINFEHEL